MYSVDTTNCADTSDEKMEFHLFRTNYEEQFKYDKYFKRCLRANPVSVNYYETRFLTFI